ncbi:quinone oxidoreductase family protein [Paraoerskovia marina]|uniref:NADPH2:quinone reductase n=1 Tax=Paraoerskovia marina TaxID=545619 RepID=A0A1H1TKE6_9CELL|nr:quinone oxidoreductase [Paraoerskovia marina]SDS60688.1 NADPH2:quinone reductase [Paraoerskovia marina]
MHAIVAREAGGPEVLDYVTLPDPGPTPGRLLVRVAAIGVNYIDTYRRSGAYPSMYPHLVGSEGSGWVVDAGDVPGFAPGDHVAWADGPASYAEMVSVDPARALRVPPDMSFETAAALPIQSLTAHYLSRSTYPATAADTVLVHAGAGGVGLLLTQMLTLNGARVLTTVSSDAKAALSLEAGADAAIRYDEFTNMATDLPKKLRAVTGDKGVDAVFDSVGKVTFDASLASLAPRGMLVLFGASSGMVPAVDPQRLKNAGSVFLTRPQLSDHVATRSELVWRAQEILRAVNDGTLQVRIGATYPLSDAAQAHRDLEGRNSTGKLVLIPDHGA